MKKIYNIGIIGAGHIAGKMARTLAQVKETNVLAVGSRTLEKAQSFAQEFGVERAYGSYEEVFQDQDVDLVYIATPHSHHYAPARQALLHDKPVLMEKAFTNNAKEAEELIRLSHERGVYLGEAIWTRYMPISHKIKELMESGIIGEPRMINACLSYKVDHKERVIRPELGGGALLDLGIYLLNFARMYFGTDIRQTISSCQVGPTGVDVQESITLTYTDGKMANLMCGVISRIDRQAVIGGTEGYLKIDNVNNPGRIEVYRNFDLVETHTTPQDIVTGYEYQVLESCRCIEEGLVESPMMPHAEILSIMQQMDALREEWGVRFPGE